MPDRGIFADADTPAELLGLLAGAASMCWKWNDPPTAEFDSERASALVDAAVDRLIELGWAPEKKGDPLASYNWSQGYPG